MEPAAGHVRDLVTGQLATAWKLLELHLTDLSDDECLWRPAARGPHVFSDAGAWRAAWPETESYDAGPPSIAWLTWHIGFWWSMALDHSFGPGTLRRDEITWPGSAKAASLWLTGLHQEWRAALATLSDADFASVERSRWPFSDRPFCDLAAWLNLELMKNAAEIGYGRFLYALR